MSRRNPRRKNRSKIIPHAEVVHIPVAKFSKAGVQYTHYEKALKGIDPKEYIKKNGLEERRILIPQR